MKKEIGMLLIIALFVPMFAMTTNATLSTTHEETPQNLYVETPVTLKTTDYRSSNLDPSTDQLWVNVTLPNGTTINIAYESFSIDRYETKTFTYTYYPPISGDYTVTYDYHYAPDQIGSFTAYLPDVTTSATDMVYVDESIKIDTTIETTIGAYNGTLDIYINGTGETPSLIDSWSIVMDNYETKEHVAYYKPTKNDTYTITYDFSADELDRTETFIAFNKPTIVTDINPSTMWQGNTTVISYSVVGNNTFHPDLTVRAKITRPDGSYYYTVEKTLSIPSSDTLTATVSWDIKQIVTGHYGVYFEELNHGINANAGGFDVITNPEESVTNNPPVAFISADMPKAFVGDTIRFEGDASDIDGIVVNYTWDFGDGTKSYLEKPVHHYESAGTYTVTLVVMDNDGGKGYANMTVEVFDTTATKTADGTYLGMPTPYFGILILVIGGIFLAFNIDSRSSDVFYKINFLAKHGDFFGMIFIIIAIEEILTDGVIQRFLGTLLGF